MFFRLFWGIFCRGRVKQNPKRLPVHQKEVPHDFLFVHLLDQRWIHQVISNLGFDHEKQVQDNTVQKRVPQPLWDAGN